MYADCLLPSSFEVYLLRKIWKLKRFLMSIAGVRDVHDSREHTFASIINDYGSMISGICFSFAADENDVADLRQDILLNIWRGLATYNGTSSLSTWLYRVALNTCVSTVRKRRRSVKTVSLESARDFGDEQDIDERERIEWLYNRLASLSPLDKAIVTMWLDERPYEEIAKVMGLSRNNVAVRLNRIRRKLASD